MYYFSSMVLRNGVRAFGGTRLTSSNINGVLVDLSVISYHNPPLRLVKSLYIKNNAVRTKATIRSSLIVSGPPRLEYNNTL